jgi:hypothetical protein
MNYFLPYCSREYNIPGPQQQLGSTSADHVQTTTNFLWSVGNRVEAVLGTKMLSVLMSSTRHHGRYKFAPYFTGRLFFNLFFYGCASHSRRRSFHCIFFVRAREHTHIFVVVQQGSTGWARWPLFVCTEASFAADSRVSARGGNRAGRISLNKLDYF